MKLFQKWKMVYSLPGNPEDFAERILKALRKNHQVSGRIINTIPHEFDLDSMVQQEGSYFSLAGSGIS